MKLRSIAVYSLIFFACAASADSQAVPTKLAFIDTGAFTDEKAGITKYVNAYKGLAIEFKTATDEINGISTRLGALSKEAKVIQDKLNGPPAAGVDLNVLRASFDQKVDEGERLQIDMKRRQEDLKAKYEKREAEVTRPIMREIGAAIEVFRKAKGYDLILDAAKIGESILGYDRSLDITDAFIADFNSKASGVPAK